jgi:hypothetical protein
MENKRSHPIRYTVYGIIIFAAAAALMLGALLLSALIPRESIREKTLESAEYLYEGELFGEVIEGVEGSRIDRYADSILLNIAYHYSDDREAGNTPGELLRTVLLSAYYFTPDHEENENFLEGVRDDRDANRQYMRYWHGSIALVRPLLTVFSVRQIYILNAVILLILAAGFILRSVIKKRYAAAVGMTAALLLTGSWFVPLSLEYTWTFLLMLIAAFLSVHLAEKGNKDLYAVMFLILGMLTGYLDFLTTETLTLLIPLLLILYTEKKAGISRDRRELYRISLLDTMLWAVGYAGMWILKWVLTAAAFGENVMPYVSEHIEERIGGDMGMGTFWYLISALIRNIGCLFPAGYGTFGMIAGFALVLFAVYTGYVYHEKDPDRVRILIYSMIALVPYVRYLVLHNHSFLHCFFTYRAQAAAVMAVVLILCELTQPS